MYVSNQVIDFIEFVLIGVLIASIFDFFRAYRKIKKVSTLTVMVQDSIYFIIVTMVIIFSIIKLLDSQIRLYVFLGILIGCSVYFTTISKYLMKLYILFFNMFREIISTIFLPLILILQIILKFAKKTKKIIKKCCKKFLYVISCICKFFKSVFKVKPLRKKTKEV